MSSIEPDATRKLAATASEKGLSWVDSPLSGGAPKALIGELTLMLGGEDAAVERARRPLSYVAKNITHMGGPGAGQTTKMINQGSLRAGVSGRGRGRPTGDGCGR